MTEGTSAPVDLAYVEAGPWVDAYVIVEVGVQGEAGPAGQSSGGGGGGGGGTVTEYVYTQTAPATTWTIVHQLNRHPDVRLVDPNGNLMITDVAYPDVSTAVATFGRPTAGTAYVS